MNDINQQLQEKIAQLEQQEATIRQQEEFLRIIYNNVQEAIFVVDVGADGKFRYQGFNPAAHRLTGIKTVIDKTPADLLPPEAAETVEQRYRQCLESKTNLCYEECLPFQGEDTWCLTTLNPIQDKSGNVFRIIGTSLNINERKQAETELDQEKNFLQALLDNLSDGIVSCDRYGVLNLFNRATKEFHGLPQQSIPTHQWAEHYDLYLPDGKTLMASEDIPLFRALKGESVRDVEMMIVPKQGKPRIVLANGDSIYNKAGEKIGAISAMRDISDRRQAEAELEQEKIFLKALLDNLTDSVVACDRNGILAMFNRASLDFFIVPQEPLPPEAWAKHYGLYDPEGKRHLRQSEIPLVRAFAGESFVDVELMAIPDRGQPRTLSCNGSPIIDSQGTKIGAVVAIKDITERKQAEREISQLNAELESKVQRRTAQLEQMNQILLTTTATLEKRNAELDQFAYVTSHDLKAPLRAIANLSLWIEEDLEDKLDEDTRHNMNLLRGRVKRLENLINGLLDYSRVGRLKSEPESVNVGEMLTDIIEMFGVDQSCQIQIRGNMPTIVTHLVPLQQVFNNLIGNAIKHGNSDDTQITVSVRELDNYYQFAVTDNGQGIDSQYHDRIFTIFQTLEARDTKESTGIGLAIVKKAVESQGGKIEINSQLGMGTTFKFTWKKL